MYCVKCGVRLQEGTEYCPLCNTRVLDPDRFDLDKIAAENAGENAAKTAERLYSGNLPKRYRETLVPVLATITALSVLAILIVLIICLRLYGRLFWGGYVIGGIALFYVTAILPAWFDHPSPAVFVPVDFAAAALYVLLICAMTGGHWYMSFAFPVILLSAALAEALVCLLRYVKHGRLFIVGGFMILLGGFLVLVEFFEHISFGTAMFLWSPYPLAVLCVLGIFLLICGIVRPLRASLEKHFFF